VNGVRKSRALGIYPEISLKVAREAAYELKHNLPEDKPVEVPKPAFSEVAEVWFGEQKETWSPKHVQNVRASLDELYLTLGTLPIDKIIAPEILRAIKTIEARGSRLNVCITPDANTNPQHEDELGTFIFRTTGFNSIRTLAARLAYYQAVSGNLLSCLPLQLKLRGKSTTQSYRTAIYYVDVTVRDGLSLNEAIQQAKALHQQRLDAGFDQVALDQAAKAGFKNGLFELNDDEMGEVLEEFYSASDDEVQHGEQVQATANKPHAVADNGKLSLKQKLESKAGAA
jgi:hypothetical protein